MTHCKRGLAAANRGFQLSAASPLVQVQISLLIYYYLICSAQLGKV